MRNPFRAFTDPGRRPRAVIWTGVVVIGLIGLFLVSMIATSTVWFCSEVCHNVYRDLRRGYHASTHNNVSCMACHYPANVDPVRFTIDRVDKLLDIYPTITGTFELPLNQHSRLGLMMPSSQCTQCHADTRRVSPTPGLKIDHAAHDKAGIGCTACHNRVAHPEPFKLTLPDNEKHQVFLTMRSCHRCHTLGDSQPSRFVAPGRCIVCHTRDFDLVPRNHKVASWIRSAEAATDSLHAIVGRRDGEEATEARREWAEEREEFLNERPRILLRLIDVDTERPLDVPPPSAVSECGTCHRESFCTECHTARGVEAEIDF